MPYTHDDLETCSRKEIQAIAKELGLKCNGKTVDLIKEILSMQPMSTMPETSLDCENEADEKEEAEAEAETFEIGDTVGLIDDNAKMGVVIKVNKKSVRITMDDTQKEMTLKFHEIVKMKGPATGDEMDIEVSAGEQQEEEMAVNKSIRMSIESMIPLDTCLDVDGEEEREEEVETVEVTTNSTPFSARKNNNLSNSGMKSIIESTKNSLFSPKPVKIKKSLSSPKRVFVSKTPTSKTPLSRITPVKSKTPLTGAGTSKKMVSISAASPMTQEASSSRKSLKMQDVAATTPTSIMKSKSIGSTGAIRTPVGEKRAAPVTPKSTKSQLLRQEASLRKKRIFEEIQRQAQSEVDEFLQSSGVAVPPSSKAIPASRVSTAPTPVHVNSRRGAKGKEFTRSRSSSGIRKNSLASNGSIAGSVKSSTKAKPKPNFDKMHQKEFGKSKSITNITPRDQHLNDKMTNALKQRLTSSLSTTDTSDKNTAFTLGAYTKSNIPEKFTKKTQSIDQPYVFKAKKLPNFKASHNKWAVKTANTSAAGAAVLNNTVNNENKPKNLVNKFKF